MFKHRWAEKRGKGEGAFPVEGCRNFRTAALLLLPHSSESGEREAGFQLDEACPSQTLKRDRKGHKGMLKGGLGVGLSS